MALGATVTEPTDLYPVIAQIAATFAGFGSLASGLGQRLDREYAKMDAFRLAQMLQASLSATMLGLLPATLAGLSLEQESATRISAFVALSVFIVFLLINVPRAIKLRHAPGFSKGAAVTAAIAVPVCLVSFALCALGIPADRVAGLYLLGLMLLLFGSIIMFSRVIVSMLRRHNQD